MQTWEVYELSDFIFNLLLYCIIRSLSVIFQNLWLQETKSFVQVSQSIVHQSYGIPQVAYLQTHYNNTNYLSKNPSYQLAYPSALQYQAISPMYNSNDSNYQPPPLQLRQYQSYNQYGNPIKTYVGSPTKHIPYEPPSVRYSPTHRLYGPVITVPSNKEKTEAEVDVSIIYYVKFPYYSFIY